MKEQEKPTTPTRPYRFLVDGYTRIIKGKNARAAMKEANRKWGIKAIPQFPV